MVVGRIEFARILEGTAGRPKNNFPKSKVKYKFNKWPSSAAKRHQSLAPHFSAGERPKRNSSPAGTTDASHATPDYQRVGMDSNISYPALKCGATIWRRFAANFSHSKMAHSVQLDDLRVHLEDSRIIGKLFFGRP